MRERVVITGIGCISSFGIGREALGEALMSNTTGIVPISAFDTSDCSSHRAATIHGFDPGAFISPMKRRRMDRVSQLTIACAQLVFDDAGQGPGVNGGQDIGMALGTFTAGLDSLTEYLKGLVDHGPPGVPAILFSSTISNAPASLCAIEFGLRGPNVTFNQREASSFAAIAFSVGAIREGRIRAMVSGGADCLEETFFKVHDHFRVLSPMRAKGTVDEAARPFDRHRNGFILGEGGYLVLLESAAAAEHRSARIYGEIVGIGAAASKTALNQWPSDPLGFARVMRLALSDAHRAPDEIDAVVAVANGSPQLDRVEAAAIRDVFGTRPIPVVSMKGAVGESGATGAAGVISSLGWAGRGLVPPTVGFVEQDPACMLSVTDRAQPIRGGTFLLHSVAAGGTHYAVIVSVS
jgi:3-oxoacyl-[acyl-carrier-protein] synthase II